MASSASVAETSAAFEESGSVAFEAEVESVAASGVGTVAAAVFGSETVVAEVVGIEN